MRDQISTPIDRRKVERLTRALLANPRERDRYLALVDEHIAAFHREMAALDLGYQMGRRDGYWNGYSDCDDEWLAGLDDAKAYARMLFKVPGYAELERLRYGPPWLRVMAPAGLTGLQRRRWYAHHPSWDDPKDADRRRYLKAHPEYPCRRAYAGASR